MTETVLVTLITAVLAPVSILFVKWRIEAARANRSKRTIQAIRRLGDIYVLLNDLRAEAGAVRVVLMRAENNGGLPQPGVEVTTSVIHEVTGDEHTSIRKDWYRQPVDSFYSKLLSKIAQSWEPTVIDVATMENGFLKDFYIAHGVVRSQVFPILATRKAFSYLSITWGKEVDTNDPKHRDTTRTYLRKIESLLESCDYD